jgi:hypothetical protein
VRTMRTLLRGFFLLAAIGCGESATTAPPTRTAAADPMVRALMHDAVGGPQTCHRLLGKVVALPTEGNAPSTDQTAGLALAGGRLVIRSCDARSDGRSVWLQLGGIGWQWVDRTSSGFHLQQHVYFSVNVALRGELDVGYDPAAHLASVWLTPVGDVDAQVQPLGHINARPQGLGHAFGVLLNLGGMSADNIARARAGTEGAQRFRERLAAGLTATYDTSRQQLDMALGRLPNGVAPLRPFRADQHWLVNERVLLMPGGFQLVGPFEASTTPLPLSVRLEQGAGVTYRAVCESDVWRALDAAASGAAPIALAGQAQSVQAGYAGTVGVVAPQCRWLLALAPMRQEPTVAALHLAGAPGSAGVHVSGSAWARVTLLEFELSTTKPDGTPWDVGGGAPDPEFTINAGGQRCVLAGKMQDTFKAAPMTSCPSPVEVSATSPLVVEVTDKDLVNDDPMGVASVTLSQLAQGAQVKVPIVLGGVRTGWMRLGVELRTGR